MVIITSFVFKNVICFYGNFSETPSYVYFCSDVEKWECCRLSGLEINFKLHQYRVHFQIAGARPGYKGNEFSNMILSLTPTAKISSARVFNEIVTQVKSVEAGFRAYDCYTDKIETVRYFRFLFLF